MADRDKFDVLLASFAAAFVVAAVIAGLVAVGIPGVSPQKREADARAIDEVINILRMARCARDVGGEVPETFLDGVTAIQQNMTHAREIGCDWAPTYFSNNPPSAIYSRATSDVVSICVTYHAEWPDPAFMNYHAPRFTSWPEDLPALRAPVAPGPKCYEVDVQSAPLAVTERDGQPPPLPMND